MLSKHIQEEYFYFLKFNVKPHYTLSSIYNVSVPLSIENVYLFFELKFPELNN